MATPPPPPIRVVGGGGGGGGLRGEDMRTPREGGRVRTRLRGRGRETPPSAVLFFVCFLGVRE